MREEINNEVEKLINYLGWVVHNFNHLERTLAMCVSILVDPSDPQIGRIVTAGKAYSAMVDLFSALSLYRLESVMNRKLENDLNSLLKRLTEANELRNKVVHSQYLYGVQEKSLRRSKLSIRIKKGVKLDDANINSKTVYELSKDIQRLTVDLRKFTETEFVPVVLSPIWQNKDDDPFAMWMDWKFRYQELEGREGKVYWEFLNR